MQVNKLWREKHPSYPCGYQAVYESWSKRLKVSFILPFVTFYMLIKVIIRSGELVGMVMEETLGRVMF
jgi:hypothetical protein